jgi:hypothetical protein
VSTAKRKKCDEDQGYEQRDPGAHNQVILPHRSGGRWNLRYGPVGAELGKGFLRRPQDSLDRSAGNAELLGDSPDGFPGLPERQDAISVEDPRREPQALALETSPARMS